MRNPSRLIGAHVTYTGLLVDHTLLGTVTGIDYTTGVLRLKVQHFNGEPWPFDPLKGQVDVLKRD
jgi:hypothetical protein